MYRFVGGMLALLLAVPALVGRGQAGDPGRAVSGNAQGIPGCHQGIPGRPAECQNGGRATESHPGKEP